MSALAAHRARLASAAAAAAELQAAEAGGSGSSAAAATSALTAESSASAQPGTSPRKRRKQALATGAAAASSSASALPNAASSAPAWPDERAGPGVSEAALTWQPLASGARRNWAPVEGGSDIDVGLHADETLAFSGQARLRLLHGQATISGARLRAPDRIRVLAPKSSPLPVLRALSQPKPHSSARCSSTPTSVLDTSLFAVIVRLGAAPDCGLHHLPNVCALAGIDPFGDASESAATGGHRGQEEEQLVRALPAGVHLVLGAPRGAALLAQPDAWETVLAHLSGLAPQVPLQQLAPGPPVLLVRGAKRLGKSTFARLALAALLSREGATRVAWLDADPGQGEFGPPGILALHIFERHAKEGLGDELQLAPGWTLAHTPARAHFLGDTTPRDEPARYLAMLEELLGFYARENASQTMPLIVNTPGWVKGLGADLASRLEHLACPTLIIDMRAAPEAVTGPDGDADVDSGQDDEAEALAEAESMRPCQGEPYYDGSGALLGAAPTIVPLYGARVAARSTPADGRILALLAHLHARPVSGQVCTRFDFERPLCEMRPVLVDVQQGLAGGLHVLPFVASVAPALRLAVLNASLVAIVRLDEVDRAAQDSHPPSHFGLQQPWDRALVQPLPEPASSHCVALAVLRAIDVPRGQLSLLTSAAAAQLRDARGHFALVRGAIDVPVWASLDAAHVQAATTGAAPPPLLAGVPRAQVPYVEWTQDDDGAETPLGLGRRRVRRNLMRKGQR